MYNDELLFIDFQEKNLQRFKVNLLTLGAPVLILGGFVLTLGSPVLILGAFVLTFDFFAGVDLEGGRLGALVLSASSYFNKI